MTDQPTKSKFNLPTHTISAEELRLSMPKATRFGKKSRITLSPPSAELWSLVDQLHPDDPRPDFHKSKVVAAIFNETKGHSEGFVLANAWCSKGRTYKGSACVREYWDSLNLTHPNPATIRTLRWMVGEKHGSHTTSGPTNNKENDQ